MKLRRSVFGPKWDSIIGSEQPEYRGAALSIASLAHRRTSPGGGEAAFDLCPRLWKVTQPRTVWPNDRPGNFLDSGGIDGCQLLQYSWHIDRATSSSDGVSGKERLWINRYRRDFRLVVSRTPPGLLRQRWFLLIRWPTAFGVIFRRVKSPRAYLPDPWFR